MSAPTRAPLSVGIAITLALMAALAAPLAAASVTPAASSSTSALAADNEVFLQLVDRLGEPRHYCLDVPGYPASGIIFNHREAQWSLEAHTCKWAVPNPDAAHMDQMMSVSGLEAGKLQFARLNACVEVGLGIPVREDAPMMADDCADTPAQQMELTDGGQVHPAGDTSKCLTIATRAYEAGDRSPGQPWYRRPLTFSTCSPAAASRQTWAAVEAPAEPAADPGSGPARVAPTLQQQTWVISEAPEDGDGTAPNQNEVLIESAATLGEPRRHCVDIPGFPASGNVGDYREAKWSLEAHTCKVNLGADDPITGPGGQDFAILDQVISRSDLENGRIRFARLNVCLQVNAIGAGVRQDSPLVVNPCSDAAAQAMIVGEDGRIRPALDTTKCLSVFGEAFEAGNRAPGKPWLRRPMSFTTCVDAKDSFLAAKPASAKYEYGVDSSILTRVLGAGDTPTGSVRALVVGDAVGAATLRGGRGVIEVGPTALTPGTYELKVLYEGDSVFTPSADTVRVTVSKGASAVLVRATQETIRSGQAVNLNVRVTARTAVVGSVQLTENERILKAGVKLVEGKAVVRLPQLKRGKHVLRVTYSGSSTLAASRSVGIVIWVN